MGTYAPTSTWCDYPTPDQLDGLRRAWRILNYDFTSADIPPTRWEARNLIYDLWSQIRFRNQEKK